MADAKKCDICGKYYEDDLKDKFNRPQYFFTSNNVGTAPLVAIGFLTSGNDRMSIKDLCSGCANIISDIFPKECFNQKSDDK